MIGSIRRWLSIRACRGATIVFVVALAASAQAQVLFRVSRPEAPRPSPISGRLYVFCEREDGNLNRPEPRFGPDWYSPQPFFGIDVESFAAGQSHDIDDSADGFPDKLSRLPPGAYRAQAVLDCNPDSQNHVYGEGNLYSDPVAVNIDPQGRRTMSLRLDHEVEPRAWPNTRWIERLRLRSELLSDFHRREVAHVCAVVVPLSYFEQKDRHYPVIYYLPSFNASDRDALRYAAKPPTAEEGEEEFIRVYLSGQCKWGNHVFANSDTNGPRGDALVQELIPQIDQRYRTVAKRDGRFLFGHSSGGWAALWLAINYPRTFGGVWSASPDPVDFRDFQGINLYADPPPSVYFDQGGQPRPLAHHGETVALWFESFTRMDDVLKRGGQLRSFEAVFSPLGDDGEPMRMWNRLTGEVDPAVVRQWKRYDLRLLVEHDWQKLAPWLKGRVHITVGDQDTYYLDGAVRLLGRSLEQKGSDAEVVLLPGRDHTDLLTPEYYATVRRQMSELFRSARDGP